MPKKLNLEDGHWPLDKQITFGQLKNKLRSGEIRMVDDIMFIRYENRVEAFIQHLQNNSIIAALGDETKLGIFNNDGNTLRDGTINFVLSIHSFLIGEDVNIEWNDDTIRFYISKYSEDYKETRIYNFIPEDITEPIRYSLDVESGNLVFCNFFRREHLPKELRWTQEYSINGMLGIRKTAEYMATQGFGYGQTGNTSMVVYSNDKEIIIVRGNNTKEGMEEIISEIEEYLEEGEEDEQLAEYKEDFEKAKPLFDYLDTNNFKEMGIISCSMWRWECADFNKARYLQKSDTVINVPIEGNKVNVEVYEHSLGVSPISEFISSHFKVAS